MPFTNMWLLGRWHMWSFGQTPEKKIVFYLQVFFILLVLSISRLPCLSLTCRFSADGICVLLDKPPKKNRFLFTGFFHFIGIIHFPTPMPFTNMWLLGRWHMWSFGQTPEKKIIFYL